MKFDPDLLKEVDRISKEYSEIHNDIETIWREKMVFTWHWWIDVSLAVLPWILWFIVRDKKRQHSLFYAGFFTILAATLLDMAGVSQSNWNYNTFLLPYFVAYLPWDLTVMPVMAMLFYQYFPKTNALIKGMVFGVLASYIVEPIFVWLGFYEQSGWEHHYSLPIYLVIYLIGHWLYKRSVFQAEKM